MLIEAFVNLVNARGIDLRYVAGASLNTKGIARKRKLTREELKIRNELKLALSVDSSVTGTQTRVYRPSANTHSELALAMKGLPRMPELALYYSLAGFLGVFEELHVGLMRKALRLMDESREAGLGGWPMVVRYRGLGPLNWHRVGEPHDYVSKMATLVLVMDAHRREFIPAPGLLSDLMNMDKSVWDNTLAGKFVVLERRYRSWYDEAITLIANRHGSLDVEGWYSR
jgi:hypothetical protein